MTPRRFTAVAMWSLMLVAISAFALLVLGGDGPDLGGLSLALISATFGTTGLVLVWRLPANRIGWIYLTAGLLGGIDVVAFMYARFALIRGWPMAAEAATIESTLYFPWIITMVSLPILLFPDGKPPTPRWRWVGVGIAATYVAAFASTLLRSGIDHEDFADVVNPWQIEQLNSFYESAAWSILVLPLLAVALVGPPLALIYRFRRSRGTERLQLKWLVFSATMAAIGLAITYAFQGEGPGWLGVVTGIALIGTLAIPITTGMAIVRYRLYDIDRLISRTVVYGVLVALLAGVYVGAVFLLGRFLPDQNSISVAISTLAVAALFNPLRRQVQQFIDRRLYRARYDAQEVAEDFTNRLQHDFDLEVLHDDLLGVVEDVVKPEAAGLWLRDLRS
ncbi:MAG: hypothetical protein WAL25_14700 [Acidimicrobiia bacterium]